MTLNKGWWALLVAIVLSAVVLFHAGRSFPPAYHFKVLRMSIKGPDSLTFGKHADVLLSNVPSNVLTITPHGEDSSGFTWKLHGYHALTINDVPVFRHELSSGDIISTGDTAWAYDGLKEPLARITHKDACGSRRVPLASIRHSLSDVPGLHSFIERSSKGDFLHILDPMTSVQRGDTVIRWSSEGVVTGKPGLTLKLEAPKFTTYFDASKTGTFCRYVSYLPLHSASNAVEFTVESRRENGLVWDVAWDRPPTGRYGLDKSKGQDRFYLFPTNAYHSADAKYLSAFSDLFNTPFLQVVRGDEGSRVLAHKDTLALGRLPAHYVDLNIESMLRKGASVTIRSGIVDRQGMLWWPWWGLVLSFGVGAFILHLGCRGIDGREADMASSGHMVLGALFLLYSGRMVILTKLALSYPYNDEYYLPNLIFMASTPFLLLLLWSIGGHKNWLYAKSRKTIFSKLVILLVVSAPIACHLLAGGLSLNEPLNDLMKNGKFYMPTISILIWFFVMQITHEKITKFINSRFGIVIILIAISLLGVFVNSSRGIAIIPVALFAIMAAIALLSRSTEYETTCKSTKQICDKSGVFYLIVDFFITIWNLFVFRIWKTYAFGIIMLAIIIGPSVIKNDKGLIAVLLFGLLSSFLLAAMVWTRRLRMTWYERILVPGSFVALVVTFAITFYETQELDHDRTSRRIEAVRSFERVREAGMRFTEQDAEFFAVMGRYAGEARGYGTGLFTEETDIHPTVVTTTRSVHVNDLSPLVGLFAPVGFAGLLLVFAAWGLLLFGAFQGAYYPQYMMAKACAALLIVGSGVYMVLGLFGYMPFTGRLIHGLGVDSTNEMLETVVLFAVAGAVHHKGTLITLLAGDPDKPNTNDRNHA